MNATRTCSVEGCEGGPKLVRGYCNAHYLRFKRYGSATALRPYKGLETREEADARFDAGYSVAPSGCWEWTRSVNVDGYGQFQYDYHNIRAHRWSYERTWGSVPDGLVVGHKCDNKRCVNPDHLEAITNQKNTQDAWDRRLIIAAASKKTHCIHGHELPEPNARGHRVCKRCHADRQNAKQRRTRAEAKQRLVGPWVEVEAQS